MVNTGAQAGRSRCDRHLQYPIPLIRKQVVGLFDLIDFEAMGHHGLEADTSGRDHIHQTPHAFFSSRAERGDDQVIAQARC